PGIEQAIEFLHPVGDAIDDRLLTIVVLRNRKHDRARDVELSTDLVEQQVGPARGAAERAHGPRRFRLFGFELLAQPAACLCDRVVSVRKARRLAARRIGTMSGTDDDAVALRRVRRRRHRSGLPRQIRSNAQPFESGAATIRKQAQLPEYAYLGCLGFY